jgi:hypothetical protein
MTKGLAWLATEALETVEALGEAEETGLVDMTGLPDTKGRYCAEATMCHFVTGAANCRGMNVSLPDTHAAKRSCR